MKRLLVITMIVFLPLGMAAQTQHQTQHFKITPMPKTPRSSHVFIQDGAFASLTQSTGPNSSFSLQVSRGFSTTGGTSASLSFLAFDIAPDFSSLTFVQIVGAIPSTAFTGQNTQDLVLNFDTSQLDPATSFSETCVLDLTTFLETCGAGPAGMVQLQFQENGAQRTRILALEEETTIGPITTRIHQRSDNSSANAQGSVFGTSVSSVSATVGINHNSSLEVIHNK